jgi:hypothetical protein
MRAMFWAAVLAVFASAQSTERVLHFVHTADLKNQQEIATAVRTIAMIRDVNLDSSGTLTIRGAAEQIALGEWLVKTLDVESPRNPGEPYLVTGTDEAVRVLYLPETKTVQDFQEVATLVRTIAEIRYVFTYNDQRALVLRADADQLALTEFLLAEFHQPHPDTKEYRMASGNENITRVFQIASANSVQEFQQMATAARTIVNVRRVFTLNTPREIAMRGDANQIAAAAWFLNQLDHSAPGAPPEYRDETQADNVIHLFYLDPSTSIPDLQKTATSIRTNADIRQIFTYDPRRVVAVRGTSSQIDKAKDLLAVR